MGLPEELASAELTALYRSLLAAWNRQDAPGMAALVAEAGEIIGFDGSRMVGPEEIASTLGAIFAEHQTPAYIAVIRSVRTFGPNLGVLSSVAGMTPPGSSELDPALNTVQTLMARLSDDGWRIEQFQSTPAAYHGRPDAQLALTEELRVAHQNERLDAGA